MDNLPEKRRSEPEIIDPEIIDDSGYQSRPSLWQRFKARLLFSFILAILALTLCVFGALLTLSVVGAFIGIPLILFGLGILIVAFYLFFGGGDIKVRNFYHFH